MKTTSSKSVMVTVEKRMTGRSGKGARKAIETIPQRTKWEMTALAMHDAGELTRAELDRVMAG
jgi:hypothetical protein